MLNNNGYVTEGSGENVFIYRKEVLYTTPAYMGILEGVTRETVINLACSEGIEVKEAPFTRHDLYVADECFLTGTAAEIIPVIKADDRIIGNGRPGPVATRLISIFRELTRKEGTPIY